MNEQIEKLEHGLMICEATGTELVHIEKADAEKILALLKEHEAVEPKVSSTEQRCGNCNKVIEMDGWIACPWCGKPIAWNEWWNKNGGQAVKWK